MSNIWGKNWDKLKYTINYLNILNVNISNPFKNAI